jgi:hypothetical protein
MAGSNRTEATDAGGLPEPDRAALRNELRALLPRSFKDEAAAERFLGCCLRVADRAEFMLGNELLPAPSVVVRRLWRVQRCARELQQALAALDAVDHNVMAAHFVGHMCSAPAVSTAALPTVALQLRRRGELSGSSEGEDEREIHGAYRATRDLIAVLEQCAEAAAAQYRLSRQNKPTQDMVRRMVREVAQAFKRATGRLPPVNASADGKVRFAQIMAAIGRSIARRVGRKIRIGPQLTREVVREMRTKSKQPPS